MRGKLIVIEGVDCSGKQTQVEKLCNRLNKDGIKSINLSFPMYDTPTGKIIDIYLGRSGKRIFEEGSSNVDPYVSSLYFIADRKYNIDKINTNLDSGVNVILDRYTLSNLAHQGSKISDDKERYKFYKNIEKIENEILEFPKMDLCFFLNVSLEYINKLMKNRNKLDDNEKDSSFLINSSKTYLELSKLYNVNVIECIKNNTLRSIDDINDEIYSTVKKYLER